MGGYFRLAIDLRLYGRVGRFAKLLPRRTVRVAELQRVNWLLPAWRRNRQAHAMLYCGVGLGLVLLTLCAGGETTVAELVAEIFA